MRNIVFSADYGKDGGDMTVEIAAHKCDDKIVVFAENSNFQGWKVGRGRCKFCRCRFPSARKLQKIVAGVTILREGKETNP